MALDNWVRLRISRSRTPTSIKAACCSAVFTGTKRIPGRLIASQSASASAASFLPLDVRLDQLRRHQLPRMPERLQQPRTMVAGTAGFDRDHRRRKLLEECEHLLAPQLLPQNRFLSGVYSVKLENVFRRIHTNSANLFHGRPPLSEIYSDLILAPFDAVGGRPHQQNRDFCDSLPRPRAVPHVALHCLPHLRGIRQIPNRHRAPATMRY